MLFRRQGILAPCRQGILALCLLAALGCRRLRRAAPVHPGAAMHAHDTDPAIDTAFIDQYAHTNRFRLGEPSVIQTLADGSGVLYLRSGARSFVRDLYFFDATTGQSRVLLTAAQILGGADEALSHEELARRERMRLAARGIASYQLTRDGSRMVVPLSGRLFVVERATLAVRALPTGTGPLLDPRLSPDGRRVAYVRAGALCVIDLDGGTERALSTGASATVTHGLAEFVAQEEMDRMEGYWWSPDGSRIAYQETDTAGVETFHIADAAHPERAPTVSSYPRAGRTNASVRVGVVAVTGGPTTWLTWDRTAYPYLARVVWQGRGPLTLVVQNRPQTEELVLAADATGATRTLHTERDAAWINLDPTMPRWLPDGSGFLWSTERDGGFALELRAPDGTLQRTLLPPSAGYRRLVQVDGSGQTLWATASTDPTESHVVRVSLAANGPAPVQITAAGGEHAVTLGHTLRVVQRATLDAMPTWTVLRDDTVLGTLDVVTETPTVSPRPTLHTVTDDAMHAVVLRPRDFVAGRKYPVILIVYGGPHAQMVTRTRQRYLLGQWMADQGFLVVSLDGRGTPHRGRAWERAVHRRFGSVPLDDQVRGLQALAAQVPELDLSRVGVYGWSFGGYLAALAGLRRPDVFHAAVAGAPVADWRDYDTHYTERYMAMPDDGSADDAYTAGSLLTYAPGLQRPLLIAHGTADDNVFFLHGLRLSDALTQAGRAHTFLPLVGHTHAVTDPATAARLYARILGFFHTHLRGPAPHPVPAPAASPTPSP